MKSICTKKMKKCIIIGSGLGGLSCGVILAKNGYEVTILEQGQQIGGCLQCFQRGTATFDTGMHYIGSASKGQVLQIFLEYLGVYSRIALSRLNAEGYDTISFNGKHYCFANGKDAFLDTLAAEFPKSHEELERYYDLVKQVASSMAIHSLKQNADYYISTTYKTKSVNEVIEKIISDPVLQQVLVGIQPLYAGVKDRTPFLTHALIYDSFEQSAYRIVGGSGKVAKALTQEIERLGGRVLTFQNVERIECNQYQATAAITTTGERYTADVLISAIHPASTLKMIDSPLISPAYSKRISGYQNTTSVFVVYLKFKKNSLRYMDHNLYYYRSNTVWGCEEYDIKSWPKFLLYMHFCHETQPEYAESGKILTYMNFDEVQRWVGTKTGHRGKEYEAFKRRKAELLIDALEEEIPNIRYYIEGYYTSTPLTYYDYTRTPDGAMFGIRKDVQTIGLNGISCKTRIPNLLLCGQSITSHGMFGVIAGSFITCSEILSKETIVSQLKLIDQ